MGAISHPSKLPVEIKKNVLPQLIYRKSWMCQPPQEVFFQCQKVNWNTRVIFLPFRLLTSIHI